MIRKTQQNHQKKNVQPITKTDSYLWIITGEIFPPTVPRLALGVEDNWAGKTTKKKKTTEPATPKEKEERNNLSQNPVKTSWSLFIAQTAENCSFRSKCIYIVGVFTKKRFDPNGIRTATISLASFFGKFVFIFLLAP